MTEQPGPPADQTADQTADSSPDDTSDEPGLTRSAEQTVDAAADQVDQSPPPDQSSDQSDQSSWSTGDARVDDAVARLADLDERDLHEQADVYDTIHGDLADVLDDSGSSQR